MYVYIYIGRERERAMWWLHIPIISPVYPHDVYDLLPPCKQCSKPSVLPLYWLVDRHSPDGFHVKSPINIG